MVKMERLAEVVVSTHSRPKAAGGTIARIVRNQECFNTQPPEGGWELHITYLMWI